MRYLTSYCVNEFLPKKKKNWLKNLPLHIIFLQISSMIFLKGSVRFLFSMAYLASVFFNYCLIQNEVISLALIHLHWFFKKPPYVTKDSWHMQYSDFCDSDLPSESDYTSHLPKNID